MITDSNFLCALTDVEKKFHMLINMEPLDRSKLSREKLAGVYLFSEEEKHFYVGRTQDLKRRLRNHCGSSSAHNQAVFAFKLARHATGNIVASYAGTGRRAELIRNEKFYEEFLSAKRRVAGMELRFVEEKDQLRQTLLEIYVASVLRTSFNDFETH